jgi:hypothetical protein
MSSASGPAWRVHLGTAAMTCVRFAVARPEDRDPWPLSRVVASVCSLGAERGDRPHAAGAGRGVPIVHRQELTWSGCTLLLEAHRLADSAEVSLELPSWDELTDIVAEELAVWDLVDTVADACDARWGAIGDGEALGAAPELRRHVGVLVRPADSTSFGITRPYLVLERCGLAVLLR